jgi:hypothetical protein
MSAAGAKTAETLKLKVEIKRKTVSVLAAR